MKNLTLFLCSLLVSATHAVSQINNERWVIPETVHSTAFRIETLKKGGDCTVISYVPRAYNQTVTPRDDRNLGVQYLVSGKDCDALFTETFLALGRDHEAYTPIPERTLVLDSFKHINIIIRDEFVGEGCTKVFSTVFWNDHNTPMTFRDDLYMGTDMIIESADPSQISGPFDLAAIQESFDNNFELFHDVPGLLTFFNSHDYYKLKEMQVNKNHIVEKLRADKKWKDITPKDKIGKITIKRFRTEY